MLQTSRMTGFGHVAKMAETASSGGNMKTLTSMQAQNRFGELLDAAQREPVTVTRRGRPVAFVVSPEDMREVLDARKQRHAATDEFRKFFKQADTRLTPAAHKLTEDDVKKLVDAVR